MSEGGGEGLDFVWNYTVCLQMVISLDHIMRNTNYTTPPFTFPTQIAGPLQRSGVAS